MTDLLLVLQYLTLPLLAGLVIWLLPSVARDVADTRLLNLRTDILDAADAGVIKEGAARELLNGVEHYLAVRSLITLPTMVYFRLLERGHVVADQRSNRTPSAGDRARLYVDNDTELAAVKAFEARFEGVVELRTMLGSVPSAVLLPFFAAYLVARRVLTQGGRRVVSVRDFVVRELPSVEASPTFDGHRLVRG